MKVYPQPIMDWIAAPESIGKSLWRLYACWSIGLAIPAGLLMAALGGSWGPTLGYLSGGAICMLTVYFFESRERDHA